MIRRTSNRGAFRGLALAALAVMAQPGLTQALAQQAAGQAFRSPEAAGAALIEAARDNDVDALLAVLGADARDLVLSGDPVQDRLARERFVAAYQRRYELQRGADDKVVLAVGADGFPFPFPIVRRAAGWAFDVAAAREEVLNRRIGENELNTIQVLRAIADAQREYAAQDWDGDGLLVYAKRFKSTDGQRDGLYWLTKAGQPVSPLGPLVARAARDGYKVKDANADATGAYHGYRFKLLTRQGARAPGGAYDYLADGKLLGGFAVLAYPAKYGVSGVMAFKINHDGTVYEADLGPETQARAAAIEAFDPGEGWKQATAE